MRRDSFKISLAKQKGHQTRLDATLSKYWERGDGFKCPTEKSRAMECVYAALKKSSKEQSSKAEIILSAIMSDLVSNHGVNEDHDLSKDIKKKISVHVRARTNIFVTRRPKNLFISVCY